MSGLPVLPFSRRSLLAGVAGSLSATPAAFAAQPLAPPQAGSGGSGQSAVIDVNRARTDPIPIAVPALGGGDGNSAQLGQDIATVVSNDLARSGLFRPIAQQAYIQAGASQGDAPNFQNWKAIGAQALVTVEKMLNRVVSGISDVRFGVDHEPRLPSRGEDIVSVEIGA